MKRIQPKASAFTLLEVLVILCVAGVVFLTLANAVDGAKKKNSQIYCAHNLKSIGSELRTFEFFQKALRSGATNDIVQFVLQDRNFTYQMSRSSHFHCPADKSRTRAANWDQFTTKNVSYFFNLSADESSPNSILMGDSDILVNGKPLQSGINRIRPAATISGSMRHEGSCTVLMGDGSVQQLSPERMREALGAVGTNAAVILAP